LEKQKETSANLPMLAASFRQKICLLPLI